MLVGGVKSKSGEATLSGPSRKRLSIPGLKLRFANPPVHGSPGQEGAVAWRHCSLHVGPGGPGTGPGASGGRGGLCVPRGGPRPGGSIRVPTRSTVHAGGSWAQDPLKAGHQQSSSLFFLLLPVLGAPSPPHRESTSLEGPRWPRSSPSAGGSGPAFQPWWQLLFSVVVPGPSPRPRWPSACAGGRPEATLLPRRRPPGPSWLLAPTPAPSLSLLSWIRF